MFDSLFTQKSSLRVGVDISSTSVKVLLLTQNGDRYQINSYGVLPIPPNVVVENDIKDRDAVGSVIRDLVKITGIKVKNAAIAVPDSSVITKVIQMNSDLNAMDMENQVMIEAERYIPHPLSEVSLDFEVLGPSEKNPEISDVLLVASHTANVESRVAALNAGGLNVDIVDVESYAVERACGLIASQIPSLGIDKTIAVVDVGAVMTTLTVLHNMNCIFTRSEVFGGRQLTEEIQRHYGISAEEAGLAKKQGGLPEDYATEVLQPFKESLVLYVRRALQFFFSASQPAEISHVILGGGTASIPGLGAFLSEQIGIPTSIANPFADMTVSSSIDMATLTNDAPSLLICCGLALRSFVKRV